MKHITLTAVTTILLSAALGCSSKSNPSTTNTNSDAGDETCPAFTTDTGNLKITAATANNYTFWSKITFDPKALVAPKSTLTFDWHAVTTDFLKQPMNPKSDVGILAVVLWTLSPDELAQRLNDDDLPGSYMITPSTFETQGTVDTASTTDLTAGGEPITNDALMSFLDYSKYGGSNFTYLLIASHGTTPGQGAAMMRVFALDNTTTNTTVAMDNNSTKLDFTVDLHSLKPTLLPPGEGDVKIDWSSITTNSMGRTFTAFDITRVLVASFDYTPTELEGDNFLKLESLATNKWENNPDDLAGTDLVLSTLKDSKGNAFAGIDSSHTWILALECGTCRNPAPWYLTILKTCSS